ncbi:MAG: cytochrome c [Acidobacteria bacterium]|nr:cytochrome c [Acidobacteriota bacterium]
MYFLKVFVIVCFVGIALFSCTSGTETRTGIILEDSKSYEASLFRQNCAVCHGREASGKMVNGVQVPSLRVGDAATKSEEEIYQQIAHGKLPMPGFQNQLTEKEMRMMVKFIMNDLQGRDRSNKDKK